MIEVKSLNKTFKVPIRNAGLLNALKAFTKREYRYIKALDNIDFTINEGEIVGYIGPNGAGKSSTIKIMSGILRPDTGNCTINGIDPFENRKQHAHDIGVVFGQRTQLWWDIPVIDSFDLLQSMYNIPKEEYTIRVDELIHLLDIEHIIKIPTRQLSLGQRMRCEICASLLHNPKVLFLDEPTIGLDAVSKISVRRIIKEINSKYNTTVVLTTHDMQDIEALATRIILIGKGQILFDGNMDLFKQTYKSGRRLKLTHNGSILQHLPFNIIMSNETSITIDFDRDLSKIINDMSDYMRIDNIEVLDESIDEMMVHVYKGHKL